MLSTSGMRKNYTNIDLTVTTDGEAFLKNFENSIRIEVFVVYCDDSVNLLNYRFQFSRKFIKLPYD